MYISFEEMGEGSASLKYNKELAKEYFEYHKKIQEDLGIVDDIRTSTIAKSPDVLSLEEHEINEEEMWDLLKSALEESYAMVEKVKFDNAYYRHDIGQKALKALEN